MTPVLVSHDFNAADDHIAEQAEAGDVVITADIPLAARIVEKGAVGINPHWGTPRNPWDASVARIPGGSSYGAGVSLWQGSAMLALGTLFGIHRLVSYSDSSSITSIRSPSRKPSLPLAMTRLDASRPLVISTRPAEPTASAWTAVCRATPSD